MSEGTGEPRATLDGREGIRSGVTARKDGDGERDAPPRYKSAIGVCCGVEKSEDANESLRPRSEPEHVSEKSVTVTLACGRDGSNKPMGDEDIGVSMTGGTLRDDASAPPETGWGFETGEQMGDADFRENSMCSEGRFGLCAHVEDSCPLLSDFPNGGKDNRARDFLGETGE